MEEKYPFISLGNYKNNLQKIIKTIHIVIKLITLLKRLKFNQIDFIMGISPVHASIVSKFVRSTCIRFIDTDFAPQQFYIYSFFSDYLFTPNWFPLKFCIVGD